MVKIELTSDELATIIELLVDEIIIMRDMNELDGEDVDRTTEELDELADKLKWEEGKGQYKWRLNPNWEIVAIEGGWALFANEELKGQEADLIAAKDRLELLWRTEGKGFHA
jgi:hypothetical protein